MPQYPSAQSVIDAALSQKGTTESPAGSNLTPYGKAYGWNGVAWCGIFVWWSFRTAGIDLRQNAILNPQFTPWFWDEAKKAGWAQEADDSIQPGDVLFFDFVSPFNTAGIQHTGIALAAPSGGYVQTVEGNTSSGNSGSQDNGGGVFVRTRSLSVIVAAVRPPYAAATATSLDVDGVLGAATIRRWQSYLNGHGAKPRLDVDGQLGPATWRAVDVWLGVTPANGVGGRDTVRALQRKVGTPADGILGVNTIRALQRWLNNHR
jgi:hypothetical protein